MRVLQLGAYPPPHGGVQTNIVAIRQHLLDHDIPCAVINLTRHRDSRADDLYHPTNAVQVLRLLTSLKYDIAHMHHGGELTARLLALYGLISTLPGKKTVLTCHSGGYGTSAAIQRPGRWSFPGCVFRRLDRIIAVNSQLCDTFRQFGVQDSRIRLILPFAIKPPDPGRTLPAALGSFFAQHQPRLLSVGLLEPEYDLPMQINMLEGVLRHFPRAGLAMIGSGSLHGELEQLIRSKPYSRQMMLCSDVEHADTLCAIRDCDLLLRTTHYDGDAVSVREALFLGTPVVASDNGMRPLGVHLFPIRDAGKLLQTVIELLSCPVQRVSLGASGQQNMQAVLDLYRELVN